MVIARLCHPPGVKMKSAKSNDSTSSILELKTLKSGDLVYVTLYVPTEHQVLGVVISLTTSIMFDRVLILLSNGETQNFIFGNYIRKCEDVEI